MNIKNYWKPTPKKIRKIADSILAATSVATTYAIVENNKTIAVILLLIGVVSKFVSNFYSDDKTGNKPVS